MRARLGKKHVAIFGHSWGSALGVLYAARLANKVAAYVGCGQYGDWPAAEAASYATALAEAQRRKSRKAEKTLRAIGPPPYTAGSLFTERMWFRRLEGQLGPTALWAMGRLTGSRGSTFMLFFIYATDREYQGWWPGVHLQLHTLKRCPNNVGNIVYMDEFIGEYRVEMTGAVVEAIPSKKLVWQLKKGMRLPVRLSLELDDDEAGVFITHTIRVGFGGLGSVLDPAFRLYFSGKFAAPIEEHVKAEFPKLRVMLARTAGTSPVVS